MTSPTTDTMIGALLGVLDEDIRHLETVSAGLEALRALLIQRDDAGLQRLLEEIRQQAEAHAANEQKRQTLRQDLAAHLGASFSEVTLSRLQTRLSGSARLAVAARQARLQTLVRQLRREHTLTAALLADCARFNRSLMQALFGVNGKGSMTYRPNGVALHRTDPALMTLQL